MEQHTNQENKKHWYDKNYKKLLVIPVVLLIICISYLMYFYSQNGDIIYKDPSLSGGTTITLRTESDAKNLELSLKKSLEDVYVRTISDISTGKQIAVLIDSSEKPEVLEPLIEEITGQKLTDENSSIEFSGPSLGNNFYRQLIIAVIISFVLMSLVIFFLFRTLIPSVAVIFAALSDIIMAIAVVDFFGFRLSAAGIAAFLMLIGYSVDTDILLTTRVLKKRGEPVNSRIYGAFKTGMFMTLTGLIAVIPAFLIVTGLPDSFRQIFLILAIGLSADILNTWLTNASIIKWYAVHKKLD
ncbi:MAG: protein translocase subunit SecF [Nanoarchaeota archaeon]